MLAAKPLGIWGMSVYQLESDYVQRQAERLLLSVPECSEISDQWEKSAFTIAGRLRRQRSVRSAIRAEKKERSELARLWLTGITGLIGSHRLAGGHSGPSVASYNIFTLNHPSHHSRRYVSKSSTSRPHR